VGHILARCASLDDMSCPMNANLFLFQFIILLREEENWKGELLNMGKCENVKIRLEKVNKSELRRSKSKRSKKELK